MTTNAWRNQLGTLRVLSVALPSDGGVLNPRTAGKYSLHTTNVAKTIKRELARLKVEAQAQAAAASASASAPPAVVLALAPAARAKA
jgi:hypothetical protein